MSSFPSLLLHVMVKCAAHLPLPLAHALGALLGWAMYGLSPTYRRHLRDNLRAAGYRDARTRRAAIVEAGKLISELPAVWLRRRSTALMREVRGWELVDEARAAGKGVVFLTPHLGCFEIAAQVAGERMPITVLYRAPKMAWLQPLIERGRGGENVRLASADISGVRGLLAALKRREAVGILPDHVPGEGEGEWAEFFGKPAYSMTLAARFVQRPGTVCLLAYGERLPLGRGYVLHVRPLPAALPGESGVRHVNRALEDLIRERPQQYLWGYNRYKAPKGSKADA